MWIITYMIAQCLCSLVLLNIYCVLPHIVDCHLINPRRACAARATVVVLCVCMYVCLSEHAILAVRAVRSITKDAIMLSVGFAAILKRCFS